MKVKLKFNHWFAKMIGYNITFPWGTICFCSYSSGVPATMVKHEFIHIQQYKKLGTFKFMCRYFGDYFSGLWKYRSHKMAYTKIGLEKEAYSNQHLFFTKEELEIMRSHGIIV